MTLDDLREQVVAANRGLVEAGLVTLSFGNASGVDRERDVMVIKPSGIPCDRLGPADLVAVSLSDGTVVEGSMRPSSDTPTHLVLYRHFASLGGVVHTHSQIPTSLLTSAAPFFPFRHGEWSRSLAFDCMQTYALCQGIALTHQRCPQLRAGPVGVAVTYPGGVGSPQVCASHPGAGFIATGTPPRTVPRSVSRTVSNPFPGPPSLVAAMASVLWPCGSRIPLGTTKVCCGPTLAMYWPTFQPLT